MCPQKYIIYFGGQEMKKKGRPTDSKKEYILKARIDDRTLRLIDYCAKSMNLSKSEIVREGIQKVYDDLNDNRSEMEGR